MRPDAYSPKRGFSLIELSVVVAVTLVIAAIAAVRFGKQSLRAKHRATFASYISVEKAVELYRAEWHSLPADVNHGQAPPGLSSFLNPNFWTSPPPIGGRWDWNNTWGTAPAFTYWGESGPNIAIRDQPPPLAIWRGFDRTVDDDNLLTGKFVRINSDFLCYSIRP